MDNNQQDHWNKTHKVGHMTKSFKGPNPLAIESSKFIQNKAKVLELGCGVGNDAQYFAEQGFDVIATDFSSNIIEENHERYKDIANLQFEILDIKKLNSFSYSDLDLIYARLSLHYFTDKETKMIFKDIESKLKQNGILVFLCKSTKDPLYGQGELIEKDIYLFDGHIRHFFDEDYVKECLDDNFEILTLKSSDEFFNDEKSSFIKVICKKKTNL